MTLLPGAFTSAKEIHIQTSKRQSLPIRFIFFSAVFYLLNHFCYIFLWHLTSGVVYKSCHGLEIYYDLLIRLSFFLNIMHFSIIDMPFTTLLLLTCLSLVGWVDGAICYRHLLGPLFRCREHKSDTI
jgi:hypothetical protein